MGSRSINPAIQDDDVGLFPQCFPDEVDSMSESSVAECSMLPNETPFISRQELQRLMSERNDLSSEQFQNLWSLIDNDRDYFITETEFIAAYHNPSELTPQGRQCSDRDALQEAQTAAASPTDTSWQNWSIWQTAGETLQRHFYGQARKATTEPDDKLRILIQYDCAQSPATTTPATPAQTTPPPAATTADNPVPEPDQDQRPFWERATYEQKRAHADFILIMRGNKSWYEALPILAGNPNILTEPGAPFLTYIQASDAGAAYDEDMEALLEELEDSVPKKAKDSD